MRMEIAYQCEIACTAGGVHEQYSQNVAVKGLGTKSEQHQQTAINDDERGQCHTYESLFTDNEPIGHRIKNQLAPNHLVADLWGPRHAVSKSMNPFVKGNEQEKNTQPQKKIHEEVHIQTHTQ